MMKLTWNLFRTCLNLVLRKFQKNFFFGIDMAEEAVLPTPCQLQQVSTIATQKLIVTWMVEDEMVHGHPHLFQRTIVAFPEHFRAEKNANLVCAKRWWTQRHMYCTEVGEENDAPPISCSRSRSGRQKQLQTKAAPGRGHKHSEWVMWLYPRLLDAIEL